MDNILSKLKLDSHHKIERFGATFIILLVCMALVVVSTYFKVRADNKVDLTNRVIYSTEFKTSLSQVSGTVEGVYTNNDHTEAFVMLKFSDISKISTNAENYTMYLLGSSVDRTSTELKVHPTGSIYMFGATGYMGLYFTEARGFDNQILRLIVRGHNNVAEGYIDYNGTSFQVFDQLEVYFNPGGTDSEKAEFLDNGDTFTAHDIYEELIIRPQEKELREQCVNQIMQMKTDMDTISEYTARVQDDGIVVDSVPKEIANDKIVDAEGKTIADLSVDTATSGVEADTVLYLDTNHICTNGVNFKWQGTSIKEGILTELTGNVPPLTYLTELATQEHDENEFKMPVGWYKTSGELFVADNRSTISQQINTDINNLTQSWSTYYNHKEAYQTQTLIKMLELEFELMEANESFSVNNKTDVLQFS